MFDVAQNLSGTLPRLGKKILGGFTVQHICVSVVPGFINLAHVELMNYHCLHELR